MMGPVLGVAFLSVTKDPGRNNSREEASVRTSSVIVWGATFHHECGNRHGPKDRSWLTRSHYIPSQKAESKQEAMSFPPGEPGSQPLVTYLLQGCASESPHIHQYQLETKSLNI